jgi:hypothetical protein
MVASFRNIGAFDLGLEQIVVQKAGFADLPALAKNPNNDA